MDKAEGPLSLISQTLGSRLHGEGGDPGGNVSSQKELMLGRPKLSERSFSRRSSTDEHAVITDQAAVSWEGGER